MALMRVVGRLRTLKQVPNVKLVGFLDDDTNLQNKRINGIQVLDPVNIEQTLKAYRIQEVLLTPGTLQLERKALLIRGPLPTMFL